MSLFPSNMLSTAPPLDGKTPIFEEVGAAPTSSYVRPPGSIVRFGTVYYWQAGTLTLPVWVPFSSTASSDEPTSGLALAAQGNSVRERWVAEARRDLGLNPDDDMIAIFSFETALFNMTALTASGGARTYVPAGMGMRLRSGGGANGMAGTDYNFLGVVSGTDIMKNVIAGAGNKWWMKGRFAYNPAGSGGGAAGAGTAAGLSSRSSLTAADGTRDLLVGVDGAGANFRVTGSAGAAIDSGVPVDNLVHDHKAWTDDGTTTNYRVDDSVVATGTARPANSGRFGAMVFDTAAVAQEVYLYILAFAAPARALGS